jgi:hypothetical protein
LRAVGWPSAANRSKLAHELLQHHRTHARVLAQGSAQRRMDVVRWLGGRMLAQHGCRIALEEGFPRQQLVHQSCQVVDE